MDKSRDHRLAGTYHRCNVFKTKKVFIIGLHAMGVYIVVMSDMKSSVHYTSPSLETDSVGSM